VKRTSGLFDVVFLPGLSPIGYLQGSLISDVILLSKLWILFYVCVEEKQ